MDEQTLGGLLEVQRLDDGVVVGRARVAVLDLELLEVRNGHFPLLSPGPRSYVKRVCEQPADGICVLLDERARAGVRRREYVVPQAEL
jgi:hypothetical protein